MIDEPREGVARFRVGTAFAGYRLDQFLQRMIPRLSRNRIQAAIRERVRLSWDAPVKCSTPVRAGQVVYVDDPVVNEETIAFDPPVLHEDEGLLAIDKPAGLVVHPTHSHLRNTVVMLLRRQRNEPELSLCHRLDADTSGVLLLARTRAARRRMQTAFERGRVEKSYLALVHGRPADDAFEIDLPLGPVTRDSYVWRQGPEAEDARPARTRFRVLERGARWSLVEAVPVTGRRHQIRAHLALAGHPILGDKLYGLDDRAYRAYLRRGEPDERAARRLVAARTMLHAHRLVVPQPGTRDGRLEIVAPPPDDFARLRAAVDR